MTNQSKYRYTELSSFAQVKAQKDWINSAYGLDAEYTDMSYQEADDNLTENDNENWFKKNGELHNQSKLKYGDKRDYPKIDIYFMGSYQCSTTWARTLKQAKESFMNKSGLKDTSLVKAKYA